MLKAASAAGIVWASPALESVTAHAAGTGAYVQLNGGGTLVATTTAPSSDAGCNQLPGCAPSGTGSLGASYTFTGGQTSLGGGSFSGGETTGGTYTAPAGYTILDATARRFVQTGSGCALRNPCTTNVMISNPPTGLSSVTFPGPATGVYVNFRIVLCN